jgi:hypothetical protein
MASFHSEFDPMAEADSLTRSTREGAAATDLQDYAPYAILSLIALGVAVVFATLLLFFGFGAIRQQQSFVMPELLFIPVLALALAFAARRQILNSEGTRLGLSFCTWAWWISVLGAVIYVAILFGTYYAIRQGARDAFEKWSQSILKSNPIDPRNAELLAAFHGSMPPEQQTSVDPKDFAKLDGLYGPAYIAFRQCDLLRCVLKYPGEVAFDVGGLENWVQKGPKLECRMTVKVRCPEGEYTMSVGMVSLKEPGKPAPVWQVVPPTRPDPSAQEQDKTPRFFLGARLNEYGDKMREVEVAARQYTYEHLLGNVPTRQFNARLLDDFAKAGSSGKEPLARLRDEALVRSAALGVLGYALPEPAEFDELAKKHFAPWDTGDAEREQQQRKEFARVWKSGLIGSPGMALGKTPDVEVVLVPVNGGWEARVPVELQTTIYPSTTGARGRVVLRLDDPATLADLDNLRKNPGPLKLAQAMLAPKNPVPWRFARIESDMKLLSAPRPPGPGLE